MTSIGTVGCCRPICLNIGQSALILRASDIVALFSNTTESPVLQAFPVFLLIEDVLGACCRFLHEKGSSLPFF
jgi:hypothetical protein